MTGRARPTPPSVALEEWQQRAACRDRADLLDPPKGERTAWARSAAVAMCKGCPVLTECRGWVLSLTPAKDPGGICAGLTERQRTSQRNRLARERQKAARESRDAP